MARSEPGRLRACSLRCSAVWSSHVISSGLNSRRICLRSVSSLYFVKVQRGSSAARLCCQSQRVRALIAVRSALQVRSDDPVLLLVHEPDFAIQAARDGRVGLQLSGHTHNGQVFPANFVTRYQNPLSWGYLKKRQTHFFVSSGVQLWGPPVRTAGVAEIMVINVNIGERPEHSSSNY